MKATWYELAPQGSGRAGLATSGRKPGRDEQDWAEIAPAQPVNQNPDTAKK